MAPFSRQTAATLLLAVLALGTLAATCEGEDRSEPGRALVDEASSPLDDAFRIDISQIDVVYRVAATSPTLEGRAALTFTMRPGQDRALFHFAPYLVSGTTRDALRRISLDGERLDPADEADVRSIGIDRSGHQAFELRRDLAGDVEHTLTVRWSLPRAPASVGYPRAGYARRPGWIWTQVEDIHGLGNESLWPTINSPGEQARHRIELRIRDPREYVMVGSGAVAQRSDGGVQVWSLDTEREVSSYTVMLAAMPAADVSVHQLDVDGLPVTIASSENQRVAARAIERTRNVVRRLRADFGDFPMPSLQILLTRGVSGMEYYGATTTGLGALAHELAHMY